MKNPYETYDRPVARPMIVEDSEAFPWDFAADVVVVGAGGAGICAAIEAREHGATVIALDRFRGGGATRFSGGVVYAGGGTSIQLDAGIEDTPAEMARYLEREVGTAASPELIRRYCDDSRETLDWLMQHGVPFDSTFYKEKIVYPPEGYFLQYSGNEKAYAAYAKPAARGHRTVGQGFTGIVFYDRLREAGERLGISIIDHTPAVQLIVDNDGRVVGVKALKVNEDQKAEHQKLYDSVDPMRPFNGKTAAAASQKSGAIEDRQSKPIYIRAGRGVILSTGGFSHNLSMLAQNVPLIADKVGAMMRMNSLGCNGSGHRLGASIGGENRGLDSVYIGRVMAPPSPYVRGLMVNRKGERFASEDAYNSILGGAIFRQPDAQARLIITAKDFRSALKECVFSGWATFRYFGGATLLNAMFGGTKRATSIAGLAKKCGMDPAALEATVAHYNDKVLTGQEDDFGKLSESRRPIKDSTYYAINFSIGNRFAFTQLFTQGGLRVNEESGMVLRHDGSPIEGLYAAGRTAFGLCSNNYVSGLSIGDCVFSGRRAGRSCALGEQ